MAMIVMIEPVKWNIKSEVIKWQNIYSKDLWQE